MKHKESEKGTAEENKDVREEKKKKELRAIVRL